MKKTSSCHALYSSQREQNSNYQHGPNSKDTNKQRGRTLSFGNYIKTVANKVAGVLTILLLRRRKATGIIIDASRSDNSQVKTIAFSTDLSTGSNSTRSSRLKSSSNSGSFSASSGPAGMPLFTIEEIYKATQNFSPANKIGEGSAGTVYKGRLKDGSFVAVKRAKKNTYDRGLSLEFKNEVLTLSQIEHLNLVRLYGYLERGDERIIVVEYVGNGTLREHLDGTLGRSLEIAERLDIAIDVAHAITYLHMYTDRPIIHRDIKASNILITEKLRAKVADFGFARLTPENSDATHVSTQIKGTTGYLDPEYVRTYQLTEKSDVYSFGILLVELMTGRQPIEQKRPLKERVTIKWAMQKLKEGDVILVMDPFLRRSPASNMAVGKVLKLAHRCLASSRPSRPSMKECGEVLWEIRKDFRERTQPSSSASTSHQSANFPHRNAKQLRDITFGIKEGESYKFISAKE